MKNNQKILALIGGLLLAVLILLNSCSNGEEYAQAKVKPLMEAVYASGYIQATGEYALTAQAEGTLKEQLVSAGETVTKGQVLFEIESKRQEANLANAQKAYALASKNAGKDSPVWNEAMGNLAQVRIRFEADSLHFVRYRNLWEAKAISLAAFDAASNAYSSSQAALQKSQNTLRQLRDRLDTELLNAQNQLQIAREEATFYEVRSTIDGILFQSTKEVGEWVRRGETLAVLGSSKSYLANLRVDEQDILRVKTGQRVLLKIDAYPGKVYEAVLTRIYAKIDPRDQSLRVDAQLTEELPANYTGMALEANIVIREKTDALVIPRSWLLPGDSLMIVGEYGSQKVKVTTGLGTLNEVEIVSGITTATKIMQP